MLALGPQSESDVATDFKRTSEVNNVRPVMRRQTLGVCNLEKRRTAVLADCKSKVEFCNAGASEVKKVRDSLSSSQMASLAGRTEYLASN